eukprot:gnl/TRDRNA2_/TRDRNA2_95030_c0_seq1.p1 gnl/TRDRNA2_/TRDRNA2_95030_c0~~gnl/TRDRNA2_/TRDRNA2_95030_c0_seq1.p1  ORF type:complete len:388 (+),score=72.01 gnl/TRDRNA2_/TRDRNA2_95030_c0_seq1:68-1165(+)
MFGVRAVRQLHGVVCRGAASASAASLPSSMCAVHIADQELKLQAGTAVPEFANTSSVLIQVHHAGVNRPDVLQRKGVYPPPAWHSPLPGLEVSGVVVARGAEVPVDAFPQVGDKVTALADGGGYAELCAVPYGQCLPVPRTLSLREAGALPENCFTVWHNLFQQANVFGERLLDRPHGAVLIHGGTSGIGYTAIQMAKAKGLTVFTTASGAAKCQRACELGADLAIDYRSQDFVTEVNAHGGVDLVLDLVCGEYINRDLQVLRRGGRVAIIGSHGGPVAPNVDFRVAMRQWLTVSGSTIRARPAEDKQRIAEELRRHVWPEFERGSMRVVIDSSYPLERANEAHERMESSQHIGKLMLDTAAAVD